MSGITEYPATSTPVLTAVVLPGLTKWIFSYDSYGDVTVHHVINGNYDLNTGVLASFTDENSQQYTYTYDIMLRLAQGNHPDGGQTIFTYPDPLTVTRQRLTYGVTTRQFDALSHVIKTIKQEQSFTNVTYTDNCTTATDEAGKSRKSCADGLGRMTTVYEDPSGLNYATFFSYDAIDNLLSIDQKAGAPEFSLLFAFATH